MSDNPTALAVATRAGEQRAFVVIVALLSLIPLTTVLRNLIGGSEPLLSTSTTADLDNGFRYLSGLYLGMVFLIWSILPTIGQHRRVLTYVAGAIALGGVGRAISFADVGTAGTLSAIFLVVEFAVPLLILWHRRLWPDPRTREQAEDPPHP